MTTNKPSIAELQKMRQAMTAGEWEARDAAVIAVNIDHPVYDMRVMLAGAANTDTERAPINRRDAVANAAGTASLVNAAPVLLEIAAAALALREQEQVAAKARFRVYAKLNKNAVPSDENYAASDEEDRKLRRCRERYQAALAKVTP